MAECIYQMIEACETHGDRVISDDVTMAFPPGARIGMVGFNDVGEFSILKIMAGIDQLSDGETHPTPGYSVDILLQGPPLNKNKTTLGNVEEGAAEIKSKLDRHDEISAAMTDPDVDFNALMAGMDTLQDVLDAASTWGPDSQLEQAMDALRCPPSDAEAKHPSGGERRHVALRKLLLEVPDPLLLGEPTNHLDAESVLWLGQYLVSYRGVVIAVAHGRYFFSHVAEWVAEVDRGHLCPYEGNYSTYLEIREKCSEVQGKKDAKPARRFKGELEWVRLSARGCRVKSKTRLARYEEVITEAGCTCKLDFEEIQIPPGPRLGNQVLEVINLRKGFDGCTLISGFPFTLSHSGIVGVVGPNGVGKSIPLKTIVGLRPLDGGDLKISQTVELSYVDQPRVSIDPKKTFREVVSDGSDYIQVDDVEIPSHAYITSFGLEGVDQQKPVDVPSGGKRNRPNSALTFKQGGNFILLDESTSDLDAGILGSLENTPLEFSSCAVVTTHDHRFLDRVVAHILVWEGTGENSASWYWFERNSASYKENKVERLGLETARPHRAIYRKLTRD